MARIRHQRIGTAGGMTWTTARTVWRNHRVRQRQPWPTSLGDNGYGRDGGCGPGTTGGELTNSTWASHWHMVELPVPVHTLLGPVGAAPATGANPIVAAAAAMASGAR